MKKLLFILLLCSTAFGQFAPHQKPMLGLQVNKAHQLGDPVGLWLFNEGSGNKVFDLSGNGNAGTFSGDTNWVVGETGPTIDFPGSDDSIVFTYNGLSTLNTKFTLIAKVNIDAFQDRGTIVGFDVSFWWRINSGTQVQELVVNGGVDSSSTALTAGTNHTIAISHDGTNYAFYLDGKLDGSGASAGTADPPTQFRVGSFSDTIREMNGKIEFLYLFNRALSASEIADLYATPFCMLAQDDVAIMAKAAEAPVGGQVIIIQMSAIPLILVLSFIFLKGRKSGK